MTRITEIKAQIEAGGEGCVPYGSLSELLGLVEVMAVLFQDIFDPIPCDCYGECVGECRTKEKLELIIEEKRDVANSALEAFDEWNEVV